MQACARGQRPFPDMVHKAEEGAQRKARLAAAQHRTSRQAMAAFMVLFGALLVCGTFCVLASDVELSASMVHTEAAWAVFMVLVLLMVVAHSSATHALCAGA